MRTIKFRGKDTETDKWVYGFYLRLEDIFRKPIEGKKRITNRIYTGSADSCVAPTTGYEFSGDWYEVDPDSIGQFTGLMDCKGREIYEGDIVRVRITNDRFKKNPRFRNGVVTFCEYDGGWTNGCYFRFLPQRMEVIGNIHDNPELMEAAAK